LPQYADGLDFVLLYSELVVRIGLFVNWLSLLRFCDGISSRLAF